jgi:hypothetical protein
VHQSGARMVASHERLPSVRVALAA